MPFVADPALRPIANKVERRDPAVLEGGRRRASQDAATCTRSAAWPSRQRAQERQESLLRPQPLHQLDQRLLCELQVLFVRASPKRTSGAVRMSADEVFAAGARDRRQLQPASHRRRPRSAPALARLLAAADAPLQGTRAARAALAVHRGRDRLHGARATGSRYDEILRATARRPGSTTSTAAGPKFSASASASWSARIRSTPRIGSRSTRIAHRHGIASNATMLYGTIETLEERIEHLIALRESQERSPGFNAFIPLAFHPDGNELNDCGWTSGLDDIRMFADGALDARQLRSHQSVLDDPRPQGLPGRAPVRRRRHGRHARLDRRGAHLPQRRHAVGAVRRRSRVPPPDRRSRLRAGPPQLDLRRVPARLEARRRVLATAGSGGAASV